MKYSIQQLAAVACSEGVMLIAIIALTFSIHSRDLIALAPSSLLMLTTVVAASLLGVKSMMYMRGPQGGPEVALKIASAMHVVGAVIMIAVLTTFIYEFGLSMTSAHWVVIADMVVTIVLLTTESVLGWIMYKMVSLYLISISEKTVDVEEA